MGILLLLTCYSYKGFIKNQHRYKAELQLEGIFFALNFLPWEYSLVKKLEIDKTKTPFIISVLKFVYWVVLVFFFFFDF